MAMTPKNLFDNELHAMLKRVYVKTLLLRVVSGFVSFLAVSAWIVLGLVLWTWLVREPELWQTLLVGRTALVLFGLLLVAFVIYPIVRMPGLRKLAFEVENRKDLKDILAAGYEFSNDPGVEDRYSPELVREVVRQAVHSIENLEVRFLFLNRRQLLLVPVAYAALVTVMIVALSTPDTLLSVGKRVVTPRAVSAVAHEANLYGSPGNLTVLSGTDVEVAALDFGGSDEPVYLLYNLSEGFWKTEETERSERPAQDQLDEYTYTFDDVRNSMTYYFQSGDRKSPEYEITVVHKPIVTGLDVTLTPPAYTGEPAEIIKDSGGNIQALEGTQVTVKGESNNSLTGAWVRFDDKTQEAVSFGDRDFDFDFAALEDGTYRILLEDDLQNKTDEPLVYAVEVYGDNPPVLDVLEPGDDAALPRSMKLDVGFITSDDYGVAGAAIYSRRSGEEKFRRHHIALGKDAGKKEVAKKFAWDLSSISLFPGDYVEYFVQVKDNNVVTGPGVTKSRMFTISVPTMADLYERVDEEGTKRTDLIEEAIKESEELKDRVEKLARDFKKTEKMDWSQEKEVDKAVETQNNIQEKLEAMQKSLEETMESLSDNKMTSQEIGEKMEAINRLMEEINDEALKKYAEQLREAMEKLDRNQIQEALENLQLNAEEMLRSLERTEALLKEIQREQKMEELVRMTQDLMEQQEELNDETSETKPGDEKKMDELSEEQRELSDKTEELGKKLEEFAESLQEEERRDMDEASQEFSEQKTSKKMDKASEQLEKGEQSPAMESQEQALEDLITLFTKMVEMQSDMQMASSRRTSANLQRLAKSTLEISFKQEALTDRLQEQAAGEEPTIVRSLAQEQQTYSKATEQVANELHEISKKTMAVPEQLIAALGECLSDMQNSLLFLEQSKPFMSSASSTKAVTGLNEITIQLLTAAKNCEGGGGSGSMEASSAMQKLMAGQQKLLSDTQSLLAMRASQEKLLQQRQAELQRLAGQQRSLRDMANKIQNDLKQNERILGRMDKIVDQMNEVIHDMDSGVLNDETLRKEERILSRLLDAQRSVHSRDYEKKRLSETAEDVFSKSTNTKTDQRTPEMLREEIRRAMALKAPGEFEDLIKLYFRALAEEAPTSNQ